MAKRQETTIDESVSQVPDAPLARRVHDESVEVQPGEVKSLIRLAIDKGINVDALEKLVALEERVAARTAAQEFTRAMSVFQARVGLITKNKVVDYIARSGGKVHYPFASLDHIVKHCAPLLEELGMTYRWDCSYDAGRLTCVCKLRHENGHEVSASFSCPTESKAGMGAQQEVASALSFGKRQSLTQVLGLTMTDDDTDASPTETIAEEQEATLEHLLKESGADRAKFLAYAGVEKLSDVMVKDYPGLVAALEAKKKARKS